MSENLSLASDDAEKAARYIDICACANMRRAARVITRQFDEALRSTGFRSTQLIIMMEIAKRGETTLTEIADAMAMDASTLTRNLTPLEKAAMVEGDKTATGRRRNIRLSRTGQFLLKQAMPLMVKAQAEFAKIIDDKEWKEIREQLRKLL